MFDDRMTDAPAQEDAVMTIVNGCAMGDDGTVGAAAGMDALSAIAAAMAAPHNDIRTALVADAVSVVLAYRAILDSHLGCFEEEDTRVATAVDK